MAWGYWSSFSLRPRDKRIGQLDKSDNLAATVIGRTSAMTGQTTGGTTRTQLWPTPNVKSIFPCQCRSCGRSNFNDIPMASSLRHHPNLCRKDINTQPSLTLRRSALHTNNGGNYDRHSVTPYQGPGQPAPESATGFMPSHTLPWIYPPTNDPGSVLGTSSYRRRLSSHTNPLTPPHSSLPHQQQSQHYSQQPPQQQQQQQQQNQDSTSPVNRWCVSCRPCRSRSLRSRSGRESSVDKVEKSATYRRTASFPEMDLRCNAEPLSDLWHQRSSMWWHPDAVKYGPCSPLWLYPGTQHMCSCCHDPLSHRQVTATTPGNSAQPPPPSSVLRHRPRAHSMEEIHSSDNQQPQQERVRRRTQWNMYDKQHYKAANSHRVCFACPHR